MRRAIVSWMAVFVILVAGFVASVAGLNNDIYSAHGFVRGYLDALARHDTSEALSTPGVAVSSKAASDLLSPDAMSALGDIRFVSDRQATDDTRTVVYEYTLGEGDDTVTAQSEFHVEQSGSRLGLFPLWRFAESPLATLQISVLNDESFDVNGTPYATATTGGAATPYLAFSPGLYDITHESTYLSADPVRLELTGSATEVEAVVNVQPNDALLGLVQEKLESDMDRCVAQDVLMPTGCTFGEKLTDRLASTPKWTVVDYPDFTMLPAGDPDAWKIVNADATANLTASVQSLFDGSIRAIDEDVDYSVDYSIVISGDDVEIEQE